MATSRIRLGELLVRAGVLDETKLKAALAEQGRWGGRLGKILVEMGFLPEAVLARALSKQLGMPLANLENVVLPANVLSKFDVEFLELNAICPERFDHEDGLLFIAMADPLNLAVIDDLRARTGLKIRTSIAGESQIQNAVRRLYGIASAIVDDPSDWLVPTGEVRVERVGASNGAMPVLSGVPVVPSAPPLSELPAAAPEAPMSVASPSVMAMARAIEGAQKNQIRAIRALVELLVDRGAFTREEYLERIQRR
jgi:hypothetical protein